MLHGTVFLSIWRKYLLAALFISWALQTTHVACAKEAKPVRVAVRQGVMRGNVMISAKGQTFYAFEGIPFAKPPTGHLRFRAPEPAAPWVGELDATKPGPSCMQLATNGTVVGVEDCLYLNVFTTYLPHQNGRLDKQNGRLLHVMFWIHGGGFLSDTALNYSPQYLMDKRVVVVSTNYRLGALGFLSTGDDESPGNYGLRDQTAALDWVQQNIAAFGGNPTSVTIFGESAGSVSVHCHILSKLSKGLFHRAISMSGTAVAPWARCQDPLRTAQFQAVRVNCTVSNTSALVDCLRSTDAGALIRTYPSIVNLLQDYLYAPCPEKQTTLNPKPFLPAEPLALIREGEFSKVPWIVGTTSQEAAWAVAYLLENESLNKQINRRFEYFCQKLMFLSKNLTAAGAHYLYQQFVEFYLNDNAVFSQQNAYQLIEAFTDRHFIHPAKEAVEQQFLNGHHKIFLYNFAYRGLRSGTNDITFRNYGVSHGDDLRYLFPVATEWPYTTNDQEVVELMLNLWTNFAKSGNPTPLGNPSGRRSSLNVKWLPVQDSGSDISQMRYYNIGQVVLATPNNFLNENLGPVKLNMAVNLHEEGMDFWDSWQLEEN